MNVMGTIFLKQVTLGVIAILFSGNVFFVKRLVDRMDAMEQLLWSLRQEIAVMHATMEVFHHGSNVREGNLGSVGG